MTWDQTAYYELEGQLRELSAKYDEMCVAKDAEIARLDWQLQAIRNRLEFGLQNGLEHFGSTDQSGHPHGYAAFKIPDWEARQLIEAIDVARGKA